MPVDNRDLNKLLKTAIDAGKPWYVRWWNKLVYNLTILARLAIIIIIGFCAGKFAVEHPMIFAAMVAAVG